VKDWTGAMWAREDAHLGRLDNRRGRCIVRLMAPTLLVVHVYCRVLPDAVDAFIQATLANARASVQEPGIARFDIVQDTEDPTQLVLVEVYRSADAPAAHKATAHYATWRDAVAPMMAVPRTSRRYVNVYPDDGGWA
jgi:quinol monooxygenase YgiN